MKINEKKTINKNIRNIALKFRKLLEEEGMPIKKLILFGSYARGEANKESDIDLCIISSKFGKDSIDELQFLLKKTRKIDSRIEPIPVSPQEYREEDSPLIVEIKKFGREIF